MLAPWKKSAKKQRYYFASRGPSSQIYGFSISHVRMQELDRKDGWAVRNSWFWTVVLKKTLECLLDCKEIQPVNYKGNKTWILIRRTDAEAEAPILWPPDGKSLLFGKDPDAGKDWRQEEKGMTEGEMVGWHHRLSEYVVVHSVISDSLWHQASLSFTISQSLLRLMSIESVMPSNYLILCCSLLLRPSIFPCIRAFSIESLFLSGGQSIGVSASLGDDEVQGNLAYCSPGGCKELDVTEQLNNNRWTALLPPLIYMQMI